LLKGEKYSCSAGSVTCASFGNSAEPSVYSQSSSESVSSSWSPSDFAYRGHFFTATFYRKLSNCILITTTLCKCRFGCLIDNEQYKNEEYRNAICDDMIKRLREKFTENHNSNHLT